MPRSIVVESPLDARAERVRVARSARPSTAPGMSSGREQNGTETPNARATSRAVQSD